MNQQLKRAGLVLGLFLGGLFGSTIAVQAADVQANSPPPITETTEYTSPSPKTGATARASVNYGGVYKVSGYEYFVEPSKLTFDNAVFSAPGNYVHEPLYFDHSIRAFTRKGRVGTGTWYENVSVRFKNCITAYDGGNYDFILEITKIDRTEITSSYPQYPANDLNVFIQNKDGFQLNSGANDNYRWHKVGARYDINMKVVRAGTNTTVDGEMLFGALDLDRPDIWGNYSAGNGSYTESIQILSGLVGSCYVEPNTVLRISGDGLTYSATTAAGETSVTIERAGVSFLGNAKGTKIRWAGTACSTGLTMRMAGKFEAHTAKTMITYEQADGSWSPETAVDTKTVYRGGSYAYTYQGKETAVYELPEGATTTGSISFEDKNVTADIKHVIRVPRKSYTYNFAANEPFGGEAVTNVPEGVTKKAENSAEPLTTPESQNADFMGWNRLTDGTGTTYVTKEPMLSNRTYYAQWAPKAYTLTYDPNNPPTATANDIVLSKTTQTVRYLEPWGELATASKWGYYFQGWYTEPEGGEVLTAETICKGSLTAYAHWKPIVYRVRFHPNEENGPGTVTGEMPDSLVAYDDLYTLPKNTYQKTTKVKAEDANGGTMDKASVFEGWNLSPFAMDTGYADESKIQNLASADGAVLDFYAIWDDTPDFRVVEYPDRFFTLDEAQAGDITEEELLRTVVVYDRETVPLPKKDTAEVDRTGNDIGITVVGYDEEEFTELTDDSTISVRYQVKDESDNMHHLNIQVVVRRNGSLPDEEVKRLRSIDDPYQNTLADLSRWRNDTGYSQLLDNALTGRRKAYDFQVGKTKLKDIRRHVEEQGFGNVKTETGLAQLFQDLFET